jgi:hypothetical protein
MSENHELIPFNELQSMAGVLAKAGCFGFKSMEQAAALMLVAQADGLHPAKAATHYHIIQGKPSLSADAMLARFQQAGGSVKWEMYSDGVVTGTFTHAKGGSVTITWTFDRAKKAGVSNLEKYPAAMLRARCISEGVRTVFPGVIVGMYTPEEVVHFDSVPTPSIIEIESYTKEVPVEILEAKSMQELIEAFQRAVRGVPQASDFYKACQKAAAERKASL